MFDEDTGVVFRDVITLALAGFVAVVILLLPWVNPPGKDAAADIDAPGDVMFEASWPDGLNTDVDVWVQGPGDMPVGYSNKGGRRLSFQVRHRLCPGSPWERDTITSRLRSAAACAA